MTTNTQTTTPAIQERATPRRRAAEASQIMFFGTVAWLGYVWLAATLVYAVVIACVARWGSVDESLWRSLASGWQRYVVVAAGITVTTTFLRMLVRNGASRRLLSSGAVVTMWALAVILALWNVAGFAVEKAIYDANGWRQTLRADSVLAWSDLPRLALDNGLIVAAYYTTGWIIGCCYTRWGPYVGTALLLPAVVPAAAMEFLVTPGFAGMDVDVITSWRDEVHIAATVLAGGVLLAASVLAARRLTRDVALR